MESFNGKFRDEYLNEIWFMNLNQLRKVVEAWLVDYNQNWPYSALGDRKPTEFKVQELSKIGQNL